MSGCLEKSDYQLVGLDKYWFLIRNSDGIALCLITVNKEVNRLF